MANSTMFSDSARATSTVARRVSLVLLLLRLSIFVVFLMWVLDKFIKPEHAAQVFQFFYGIGGLGTALVYGLGVIQLLIILAFVVGFQKKFTYAVVLVMHAASTIISYKNYFDPFTSPNLLFFAAFPMLAGCFALYYLRDLDTRWTVN
ncbi:MAG: hypothetical protein VKL39_12700 [Leptolyngbyaceae bacterium]|nr:hypothetical protein [Leptolyngbyaceae bacterium]